MESGFQQAKVSLQNKYHRSLPDVGEPLDDELPERIYISSLMIVENYLETIVAYIALISILNMYRDMIIPLVSFDVKIANFALL